jgi:hypothetical protein
MGLSRRKPLKLPNIGANCPSKLRGEALALPRDAAFWTAALHSAGEGPVPGRAPPNQAVWTSSSPRIWAHYTERKKSYASDRKPAGPRR